MVTDVIGAILKRGSRDTAAKVLQHVRSVFAYGKALGLLDANPAESVEEVLPPPSLQRHRPALLTFPALGEVLRGMETAHITPVVRMAHRLLAFTAAIRVSNVVQAQWHEFDLDAEVPIWVIDPPRGFFPSAPCPDHLRTFASFRAHAHASPPMRLIPGIRSRKRSTVTHNERSLNRTSPGGANTTVP